MKGRDIKHFQHSLCPSATPRLLPVGKVPATISFPELQSFLLSPVPWSLPSKIWGVGGCAHGSEVLWPIESSCFSSPDPPAWFPSSQSFPLSGLSHLISLSQMSGGHGASRQGQER